MWGILGPQGANAAELEEMTNSCYSTEEICNSLLANCPASWNKALKGDDAHLWKIAEAADPCLYVHKDRGIDLGCYVDDVEA